MDSWKEERINFWNWIIIGKNIWYENWAELKPSEKLFGKFFTRSALLEAFEIKNQSHSPFSGKNISKNLFYDFFGSESLFLAKEFSSQKIFMVEI